MSNKYRLQLLSHGTVFETREEAVAYINEHFKEAALWAEPALFFYGNPERPKMILAVGATTEGNDPTIYMMDDGKIKEIAAAMKDAIESISITRDDLLSIVTASGLTFDENHIQDRVEYHPNINDDVIKNATTIAEAVEMVSAYAQEVMAYAEETKEHDVVYKTKNSEHNVRLTISEPEDDGDGHMISYISADIKRSMDDNNMLEIRDDRLFVPKISGGDTTTTETTVTRDDNGGFTVKSNVLLSDDHTIVIGDNGGLSAKVDFTVDSRTNKMQFVIGDQVKEYTIPGFSVIDSIEYDSEANDIVIKYYTSDNTQATVRIPIENVFDVDDVNQAIAQVRSELAAETEARTQTDNELYRVIQTANNNVNSLSNNVSALQTELDATQTGTGLSANGAYETDSNTYFISGATSLKDADNLLDRALNENLNSINNAYAALNSKIDSVTISKVVNVNPSDPAQYRLKVGNSIKGDAIVMPDISLVADENAERTFNLMVDGVNHGSVVIPEDQDKFLKKVTYDPVTKKLVFEWNSEDIEDTVVQLDDLIDDFDPYTAGDGIDITNNEVSVKLSENASNLLEIVDGSLTTKAIVATESDINALDERVETLEATTYTKDETDAALAAKANTNSVYSKTETDNLLSQMSSTVSSGLNSKQSKLSDSDTIEIVTDNNDVTTANVKIKHTVENDNNVIKSDSNGLFVNVTYNKATNTLSFNDKQVVLSSHTIVKRGYYDSVNNAIVLVIQDDSTGASGESQIAIPVSDLVEDMVNVANTNTVTMARSNGNDKVITADVNVSQIDPSDEYDKRENALKARVDGLFVSSYADKIKAYYGGQYDQVITVQQYLQNIEATYTNLINQLNETIVSLSDRLQTAESKIANLESALREIVGDGEYGDFADYGERISALEAQVGDYNDFQGDNDFSNDGF